MAVLPAYFWQICNFEKKSQELELVLRWLYYPRLLEDIVKSGSEIIVAWEFPQPTSSCSRRKCKHPQSSLHHLFENCRHCIYCKMSCRARGLPRWLAAIGFAHGECSARGKIDAAQLTRSLSAGARSTR